MLFSKTIINVHFILFFVGILTSNIESLSAQTQKQFIEAGNQAFMQKDYHASAYYYEQALTFKTIPELLYRTGYCYMHMKDYRRSGLFYGKLGETKSYGDFPLSLFYYGQVEKALGNYEKAIRQFKKFLSIYHVSDAYKKTALHEVESCYWAKDHESDVKDIDIHSLPTPVNTEYSEFSITYFVDSLIQLTGLQPSENNVYQSSLYFFQNEQGIWTERISPFSHWVLPDSLQIANGYYLKENNRFYCTLCEAVNAQDKRCDIYASTYTDSIWSNPIKLNFNIDSATSTQPTIFVNEQGKEVVFFVSDRANGMGGFDIWMAEEIDFPTFNEPTVLPSPINTIGNEFSPGYDFEKEVLYFSSDWHYGYGGYDIFYTKKEKGQWSYPENIGMPINSAADDIYFRCEEDQTAWMASNRSGAMKLKESACCYDVFYVDAFDLSSIDEEFNEEIQDTFTLEDSIQRMLPLTVYFHNDEPNPNSTDTATTVTYAACFDSYYDKKKDYIEQAAISQEMVAFFDEEIQGGMDKLKFLAQYVSEAVSEHTVELQIKGYCSPLSTHSYNLHLAKRRIESVKNDIIHKNETLKQAYQTGNLIFTAIPYGEEKAPSYVSDDVNNTPKSIYDIAAAQERKVSIVAVIIQ